MFNYANYSNLFHNLIHSYRLRRSLSSSIREAIVDRDRHPNLLIDLLFNIIHKSLATVLSRTVAVIKLDMSHLFKRLSFRYYCRWKSRKVWHKYEKYNESDTKTRDCLDKPWDIRQKSWPKKVWKRRKKTLCYLMVRTTHVLRKEKKK